MELFLAGIFSGCILTFFLKSIRHWLLTRALPAQHLKLHSVRRRYIDTEIKEGARGES